MLLDVERLADAPGPAPLARLPAEFSPPLVPLLAELPLLLPADDELPAPAPGPPRDSDGESCPLPSPE
ncbi:hypothetical protein AJ88_45645 [Mesorhizobium amorphae CCBAU 01583]|nr:hypothetical protein AJ88_45645 [Mesorhizobium amorphae CCBAU 01583]